MNYQERISSPQWWHKSVFFPGGNSAGDFTTRIRWWITLLWGAFGTAVWFQLWGLETLSEFSAGGPLCRWRVLVIWARRNGERQVYDSEVEPQTKTGWPIYWSDPQVVQSVNSSDTCNSNLSNSSFFRKQLSIVSLWSCVALNWLAYNPKKTPDGKNIAILYRKSTDCMSGASEFTSANGSTYQQ